jgi:DNA-binding NarL/FixJ family response regulator
MELGRDDFSMRNTGAMNIGLVSDHPIRLEGLTTVFDLPEENGESALFPVAGTLSDLLTRTDIDYLVLDMQAADGGVALLDSVRRVRPSLHVIVIGPEGQDEVVLESIIAGARAYLDVNADASTVRHALETVTSGSIWASRRLLSKLVDRLLKAPDSAPTVAPHLTTRENEVLELILLARSNREIAHQLGIEERTVKAHVGRLMRKTGADNRVELTMRALNHAHAHRNGQHFGHASWN